MFQRRPGPPDVVRRPPGCPFRHVSCRDPRRSVDDAATSTEMEHALGSPAAMRAHTRQCSTPVEIDPTPVAPVLGRTSTGVHTSLVGTCE